jgi:hypothetical protein
LNANAGGGGGLTAELLDPAGAILAASGPVTGDQTRVMVPLEWADGCSATTCGAVQLRVVLEGGAALYSFWFEERATELDRYTVRLDE